MLFIISQIWLLTVKAGWAKMGTMNQRSTITLAAFYELAENCRNAPEDLELLQHILDSIEDYHRAIIRESSYHALYAEAPGDPRQFRETYHALDQARTSAHNLLLQHIAMLNNLAKAYQLPPLYAGEISERQPCRRQVADAALALLQEIIEHRA